jgi:hypothetical protein
MPFDIVMRMITLPSSGSCERLLRPIAMLAAVVAVVAASGSALGAQAERFEGKLPFKIDESQPLNGTVGPVKVATLKITNLGRGYGRGGFGPKINTPSELTTVLRLAFDVDNPRDDDWEVTFTVELLDKSGKIIDRAAKKEHYEGEAKIFNFDHPLLEYVLPMVHEVRVTLQGRLD